MVSFFVQAAKRCPASLGQHPEVHTSTSNFSSPIIGDPQSVILSVNNEVLFQTGSFRMIGFNFDFWPSTKDKWSTCGALTTDLTNIDLIFLARQFKGSLLRLGGSPADFLLYDVYPGACSESNLNKTQKHGSGYYCPIWDQVVGQCLTLERWQEINEFAHKAGLSIAFDLNACWGRDSASAEMDFSMIEGLINATASGKYSSVFAFEFGNEVYTNVEAKQYGNDMRKLKDIIAAAWGTNMKGRKLQEDNKLSIPLLVGPDNGDGSMSADYLDKMLESAGGNDTMLAATVHSYGEACNAIPGYILNVTCLDEVSGTTPGKFGAITKAHGVELWDGEGALHGNSGVDGYTNVFTSSFWYVHQMANLARLGVSMMARQTLLGGDYELIDKSTTQPNPDYWALALWYKIVGSDVLDAKWIECKDACPNSLRAFAHRSHQVEDNMVAIIINFNTEQSFDLKLQWPTDTKYTTKGMDIYQLTGQSKSKTISLNGKPLKYTGSGESGFPNLDPVTTTTDHINLPSSSITFVVNH